MKISRRFYADVELVSGVVAVAVYVWLAGAAAHPVGGLYVFAITFFIIHNLSGIGQTVQPGQFVAYLIAFWVTTAFVAVALSGVLTFPLPHDGGSVPVQGMDALTVSFPFFLLVSSFVFEALFISREHKLLHWVLFAATATIPAYLYISLHGMALPIAFGG